MIQKPHDVSLDKCSCAPEGETHDITAVRKKGGGDPVWECIWCQLTWAEIDQKMRAELEPPPGDIT